MDGSIVNITPDMEGLEIKFCTKIWSFKSRSSLISSIYFLKLLLFNETFKNDLYLPALDVKKLSSFFDDDLMATLFFLKLFLKFE